MPKLPTVPRQGDIILLVRMLITRFQCFTLLTKFIKPNTRNDVKAATSFFVAQNQKGGEIVAGLHNKKHEKFCTEYVKDMNATQAAIRAGYSEKTARSQGSTLLTNPNIKQRVAELRDAYLDENIMTAKQVEYELTKIALGLSNEKQVVIEGTGEGYSEARIIDKPPDEKSRLKALELMAKRHRILSGDTTIDVQPVIIMGGDKIAD